MDRLRVGVLVSGRGSNLQALLERSADPGCPFAIALVVSNHADAYALRRAAQGGVPSAHLERLDYPSRLAQQMAIVEEFRSHAVELVVLAGFDRVLTPEFVAAYPLRIVNIHPSLLPAFAGGLHAQVDALQYGAKVSGCTVHFVSDAVDAGPIIGQTAVPVLDEDTAETLAARILLEEHKLLPRVVEMIARGQVSVVGRRVHIGLPWLSK